ncbi:MAG: hypothetical protein QXP36_01865 [Conexivisphaerales archaeon]
MNEDALLLINGQVNEFDENDFTDKVKMIIQSSGKLLIDLTPRLRECGSISVLMAAERSQCFEDHVWNLEVMVTFTKHYAAAFQEDYALDAVYDAYSLRVISKTLKELAFEQIDTLECDTVIDIIYRKEGISDRDKLAEILLKLIRQFNLVLNSEICDSSRVDWNFVENAEKLEGKKREILNAFILVLISDVESSASDKEAGWRTLSGMAPHLKIRRQFVYKYRSYFKILCDEKMLVREPYKGPGRKQQSWRYKVNCNIETARAVLNIYSIHEHKM